MASSIIVSNPAILSGEPVVRGTRVPFKSLTAYLERERTLQDRHICHHHPRAMAHRSTFRSTSWVAVSIP
jgi:uncharacterized protein (DUF433 family)